MALSVTPESTKGREQFRLLVDAIQDYAIYLVDPEGHIASWNRGAERIKGYRAEEVIGLSFEVFFLDEDRRAGKPLQLLEKARTVGRASAEGWRLRKCGTPFLAEVVVTPIWNEAGVLEGYANVTRDITQQKALEELKARQDEVELQKARDQARRSEERYLQSQKMEAVGRLAGGIAHDFNNLLTAINGYSELGLSMVGPRSGELNDILMEIREAGKRAAALTHQLLAFSRKQILTPRIMDLNDVVGRMQNMLHRLIGEDIHMVFLAESDLLAIRADVSQVEQVILNLVVNARDAMPGGGDLTMRTSRVFLNETQATRWPEATPGEFVALSMTDTGIGMDSALMERIFEPFFTTKELGKGTGLGLAMVYGVVKQSGGNVEVRSEPGKGATFQVLFPALPGRAGSHEEGGAIAASGTEGSGHRILIVEDEESVRNLVAKVLSDQGYVCLTAENADQAMTLALAQTPETPIRLLLTDVVLKGLDGPALASQIKTLQPEIHVIYMSGYAEKRVDSALTSHPDMAFINKPFSVSGLLSRVREALQG